MFPRNFEPLKRLLATRAAGSRSSLLSSWQDPTTPPIRLFCRTNAPIIILSSKKREGKKAFFLLLTIRGVHLEGTFTLMLDGLLGRCTSVARFRMPLCQLRTREQAPQTNRNRRSLRSPAKSFAFSGLNGNHTPFLTTRNKKNSEMKRRPRPSLAGIVPSNNPPSH